MIKFGTGGWRAIIGDGFTKQNIQILSTALAVKMKDEGVDGKGVVIGYDRRFLSRESAFWAAEALTARGIVCRIIEREAPTPLIMYTVKDQELPYGMAITASHNPAIYNGVKLFMSGGRDADEKMTSELEKYISRVTDDDVLTVTTESARRQGLIITIDPMNSYIDSILSAVNVEMIRSRSLSVALDPMYGVSKTALQTILLTARCSVDVIHERHDALFGGRLPAPNASTMTALINYVTENHCDIGIATDGDADRLGVIDNKGRFLHPNKILVLLYYYLLKYKGWRGAAVRNVATTHILDRIAADFGEICYEVPVGFKYVSSKMVETGAIIGGESSGGLTVRGHIPGKDGIYAASLLIEMIAALDMGLSEIYERISEKYGYSEMVELDVEFEPERRECILQKLMTDKLLPEFPTEIERVSYLDGCKVYFKNGGWIIARFSGTEPLLRVFCEMPDAATALSFAAMFRDFICAR